MRGHRFCSFWIWSMCQFWGVPRPVMRLWRFPVIRRFHKLRKATKCLSRSVSFGGEPWSTECAMPCEVLALPWCECCVSDMSSPPKSLAPPPKNNKKKSHPGISKPHRYREEPTISVHRLGSSSHLDPAHAQHREPQRRCPRGPEHQAKRRGLANADTVKADPEENRRTSWDFFGTRCKGRPPKPKRWNLKSLYSQSKKGWPSWKERFFSVTITTLFGTSIIWIMKPKRLQLLSIWSCHEHSRIILS